MLERIATYGDGYIGGGLSLASKPLRPQPVSAPADSDWGIPDTPPAEVLDALDRAARVVDELGRKGVTLSFEHDALTSQLRVKVQQGEATSHDLSLHGLLNLLDGDMTELDVSGKD